MSKFNHKADLSKIFYIPTMIEFMRAIQVSVQNGYTYYFYDDFEINKLESVLGKLDSEYYISDGRMDRSRRHNEYNRAITIGHFFYPSGDTVYFILMSKPSPTGIKHSNFFDKLPYKDLTLKKDIFTINHYVLIRSNQEKNKLIDGEWVSKNINEVWSYGLSEKYQTKIITEFQQQIHAGKWMKVGYLLKEICSSLPFSQVRKDYQILRKSMLRILNRYIKSSGIPPHEIWEKINFNSPTKIGYILHNQIKRYAMTDINNGMIMKKIHKNI